MLFNSLSFLVFFPITTLLYFLIKPKYQWLILLLASCIFYMAFIPSYIFILLFTIVVDYFAGIFIEKAIDINKKRILWLSIFVNVGFLFVFKYYNFFVENINQVFGFSSPIPYWYIIFPVGLSFHTFQAMSYTIEVYRGHQKAEKHFGIYALYVMFYPQLVAGPIERPQNLLPQFHLPKAFNQLYFFEGIRLIIWGLFKKMVIADRASIYVDAVYAQPNLYGSPSVLLACFLFSIEIYCDFSGYSDIALGTARAMGFDLMVNFNRPYFATSIREFWARWHISLSTWFRDYVYIPLGGNRQGLNKMYFYTLIIFGLSGLWHGARWNFVVWGLLHSLFVVLQIFFERNIKFQLPNNQVFNIIKIFSTFILVSIIWVFFRATSLDQAFEILHKMVQNQGNLQLIVNSKLASFSSLSLLIILVATAMMFVVESRFSPKLNELNQRSFIDIMITVLALIFILCLGVFDNSSFIYFQF